MRTLVYQPLRASLLILTLAFVAGFAAERALDTRPLSADSSVSN